MFLCVCVCADGHQPVDCVQIMRWWISNLGQGLLRSLGSVDNCYIHVYLFTWPDPPTLPTSWFLSGVRGRASPLFPETPTTNVSSHSIIFPHCINLSPSHNTDASHHDPTPRFLSSPPPTLPRSCHAYRIPVAAAPLPLPKSIPL